MGSNYFGDQSNYLRNINAKGGGHLSSSSFSSSGKGKKNSSEKRKQPQRGLGVAQLEKIRIHSQLGCAYAPSIHTNPYASNFIQDDIMLQTPHNGFHGQHGVMVGLPDLDEANMRYEDTLSGNVPRWHQGNGDFGNQQYFVEQTGVTKSFFGSGIQGSLNNNKKELMDFMGSSSQNSESCSSQDIDLELRLSL